MDTQIQEKEAPSASNNSMLLEVRDVLAGYDESMILKGVSIDVPQKKGCCSAG